MSQGNARVIPAGQVRAAAVPYLQKAACRLTARCVADTESVSVASVCVITTDALERSVKSVPPAQTPVSHNGK